jgi:hypothetical protein
MLQSQACQSSETLTGPAKESTKNNEQKDFRF